MDKTQGLYSLTTVNSQYKRGYKNGKKAAELKHKKVIEGYKNLILNMKAMMTEQDKRYEELDKENEMVCKDRYAESEAKRKAEKELERVSHLRNEAVTQSGKNYQRYLEMKQANETSYMLTTLLLEKDRDLDIFAPRQAIKSKVNE